LAQSEQSKIEKNVRFQRQSGHYRR
jgi:hypothetical protein